MPHTLTVAPKPGYLHFTVTGPNTKATVSAYMADVLRECVARNCYRILVEERLDGPRLHTVEVFDLIADGSDRIRGIFQAIAFVDVNAEGKLMKFAETVAVNRSLPMAVFDKVSEAEAWLQQTK